MSDRCHFCGYRLDGLPDRHNCPECGLTYDQGAEVIMQAGFGPWAYLIVGLIGMLVALFLAPFVRRWWSALTAIFMAATSGGNALYGWRCLRRRNRAILSRDGLTLIGNMAFKDWRSWESWRKEWSEIGAIRLRRLSANIVISDPHGVPTLQLAADFFGTGACARKFVDRAAAWIVTMQTEAGRTQSEPRP
jgi:hypothetical protein